MRTLTDDTFEDTIRDSATPVLVEFGAAWCGPCRMIEPVLAEIAAEQPVTVVKVDTDAAVRTARDRGVMGVPTLQLYRNGELVAQMVGAKPKSQLLAWLTPHL